MKSVITVLGQDKVGIISEISRVLQDRNININGIQQGIMEGLFTMVMLVDTHQMTATFESLQQSLEGVSRKMNLDIRIQREEIFQSMHKL